MQIDKTQQSTIPLKRASAHENFEQKAASLSYRVLGAKSRNSREKSMIKVLDNSKQSPNKNIAHQNTLFLKELLWHQTRVPNSILTHKFRISSNGKQMTCATPLSTPLSKQTEGGQEIQNFKDPQVIKKFFSDILSDIRFLRNNLHFGKIEDILTPENITFMKNKLAFFLGNWLKIHETEPVSDALSTLQPESSPQNQLVSQGIAAEMRALALLILKLQEGNCSLQLNSSMIDQNIRNTSDDVDVKVEKILAAAGVASYNNLNDRQSLIEQSLCPKSQNAKSLEEFKCGKDPFQAPLEQLKLVPSLNSFTGNLKWFEAFFRLDKGH